MVGAAGQQRWPRLTGEGCADAQPFCRTVFEAAGKAAFQSIVGAREALKRGDDVNSPEVKDLANSLSTLVQSPVLSASDKKAIGSPRTYGLGADVVIMIGGGDKTKAIEALDEILVVCKSSGLKP